jgi:MerR family transcriptional regulator/heat shock protein HspR
VSEKERPLYVISIAAELVGMHPQTLRVYEQRGLVRPQRTKGNTRLYSPADIERLLMIQQLTSDLGLNLAGVEHVMRLRDELDRMRAQMDDMRRQMQERRSAMRRRQSG